MLSSAVDVCEGCPTFKYTRIEITGTLDRLAAGESLDAIVAGYRGRVSREAVMEAVQIVTDAEAEFAALLKAYTANAYEVVLIPKGTPVERASFLEHQLGH